jgi:hypothetical protein
MMVLSSAKKPSREVDAPSEFGKGRPGADHDMFVAGGVEEWSKSTRPNACRVIDLGGHRPRSVSKIAQTGAVPH